MAGLIASLEPALTAILAFFILHEMMDTLQWLGAGLILAAVVMVQGDKK
jgi:drug/metabolite transporter (DMT)-like permease